MATCKDCLHEQVCDALIKSGCPYLDEEIPADAFCMVFKNKADVLPKSEVAMIFEELYKSVVSKIPPHIRPIFKDGMDFEDGFRNGKTDALLDVLVLIAELKKKYTNN